MLWALAQSVMLFSDFNIKSPSLWLCEYPNEKNSTGLSKWYTLTSVGTFEGLFFTYKLRLFQQKTKKRLMEWSLENHWYFSPCNLLHQPAFPCSRDYYIMTWLLAITATVGKVKAQHGAISIKGIWNSITSSEAAWLLWVELRSA